MDASDPDPGPQEREMNCRPAVGSENCGPVIIVFEGREGAPLLPQAADTQGAQTVPARRSDGPLREQAPDTALTEPGRRSGGPLARFTAAP